MIDDERKKILKMIEAGKITAEEGLKLMQAIDEVAAGDGNGVVDSSEDKGSHSEPYPDFVTKVKRFRNMWTVPLWIGVLITIGGAYLMFQVMQTSGIHFWFYCSWIPFLIGVLIVTLAFASRTARWLYVDVRQRPGNGPRRVAFGFPLPPGIIRWIVRNFGHHIPDDTRVHTDDIMRAIFQDSALDEPLLVDVREDDGEHVRVYFG
jgi:hypothetical protein